MARSKVAVVISGVNSNFQSVGCARFLLSRSH